MTGFIVSSCNSIINIRKRNIIHIINVYILIFINPQKRKYQEQDEADLDVEVLCLDGSIFVSLRENFVKFILFEIFESKIINSQVHSCVLSVPSKFLRFLVRRAQNLNPEKIQIEYKNYSTKIVKVRCFILIVKY